MRLRHQVGAILLALVLAGFMAALLLVSSGCVSTKGVQRMDMGIPAIFEWDIEFQDKGNTSMDIVTPALEDLPVAEVVGSIFPGAGVTMGIGGGILAALSSVFLLKKKKKAP